MRVLVTGATGFIGNHIVQKLLENDDIEVIATSRNIERARNFDWFEKVTYIEYDLNDNLDEDLYSYFKKPDVLIHLAWEGLPNYKDLIHLDKNLQINYGFIRNLISNGLNDVTITGTCFEYGMIDGCLNEDLHTKPGNSYSLAKDCLRKMLEEIKKEKEISLKWVRLFYMYGEGQSEKSILSLVDRAIKNEEKVFNMSGGEQLRDYLPVRKVVENIISIMNQNEYQGIINCCSGTPISIRKLVENHLKLRNYNMELNLGYYDYPDYEPMAFWGDNTKLMKIKGL